MFQCFRPVRNGVALMAVLIALPGSVQRVGAGDSEGFKMADVDFFLHRKIKVWFTSNLMMSISNDHQVLPLAVVESSEDVIITVHKEWVVVKIKDKVYAVPLHQIKLIEILD